MLLEHLQQFDISFAILQNLAKQVKINLQQFAKVTYQTCELAIPRCRARIFAHANATAYPSVAVYPRPWLRSTRVCAKLLATSTRVRGRVPASAAAKREQRASTTGSRRQCDSASVFERASLQVQGASSRKGLICFQEP
jgi:hypothetical protein